MYTQLRAVVHMGLPIRSTPIIAELTIDSDTGDIRIVANDRKEARALLTHIEGGRPNTIRIEVEDD